MAFLRLSKTRRPQLDRLFDGREIVVEQHQVRGFASDVGAPLAHRNADMRGFQRRCIVNTVAGHGYDLAIGPERRNQTQFLLRHNAGKDVDVSDAALQLGISQV